ncbi:hypothetical protein FB451DRAFT_1217448 [Mycena latifolia]|nr:hypothetical protein FB451DRAFT_1217448 [Mycena latifolia]
MYNRRGSQLNSLSFSPSLNSPPNTKKRPRQPSECDELPPMANTNDGKIKPRRIDPDRLAIRLGPELVGEMDAYIVPGAKMPTFQIRQELVTKYNVDRRHIYDYFHSRGLRVAKEDKHSNLSHRMFRKPGAARKPTAPRKSAALQVVSSDDINSLESSDVIESSTSGALSTAAVLKSTSLPKRRISEPPRPAPPALQTSMLPPSLQSMDLSDDSSSNDSSEDGDSLMSSTFDSTDILTESSSFGEDLELASLGFPISEKLSESFGLEISSLSPIEDPLSHSTQLQPDQSTPFSVRDSLLPLDGLSRLSQSERMEFYNLVNDGIGPARGIEESAGTYKAHMERLYRWHPGASGYNYGDPPASRTQVASSSPQSRPPTIIEKENINPQISAPRPVIDSRPSNNRYYTQTANPFSPYRNPHHVSVSYRRESSSSPLQPANHLVSPVFSRVSAHTHTATLPSKDPQPHDRPMPLVWTPPIQHSQPISFVMRTQQWQTQMSQAFTASAASNTFAIPYTYSGDRSRTVNKPRAITPKDGTCSREAK